MDILNSMQNGPRGQRQPTGNAPPEIGGGMSPIMMALLGLLAYKAVKHIGGQPAAPGGQGRPTSGPPTGLGGQDRPTPAPSTGTAQARTPSGSLADILGGLFGGGSSSAKPGSNPMPGGLGPVLGGAAAGTMLSGGLGRLINDLQNSGQGRVAQSWIARGPNQQIAPTDLSASLGADTLNALAGQTGLSRDDLLEGLSQNLPDFIDQLTPNGRLPTEEEASRMV